ncbi:hypothetical protein [Hoyosella subflava]|uniref:Uncharacterized protein n=1 Tax=Hoyosella subflava (strain DSM 45089 / JCM 17490 / NBRC 109087 / DQS3-9A1) TaxID=443218 RepID=F6ERC4_HOYSD|nr:hypothetical protein [Hoyosella subflava]AEF42002.1 hypothetical protein AS9A_3564 [Hoyosella subflava DQS3-9A1]
MSAEELAEGAVARARRKAALDAVFGEVLPGDRPVASETHSDRWLMENRPPHHG